MTKEDCLRTLMILSALETLLIAYAKPLPEGLSEDIEIVARKLREEVLGGGS